jgi:Ala-tRNA(Pro) deacylase
VERAKGFEPSTPTLARSCSTTELHPHPSFGSADLLFEVWGVIPGAVTPFGAINDTQARVTVVLDAPMMKYETLNYHPLVNTMTTSIARDDLVKFLESTGHMPRIELVSGTTPDAA